MLLSIEKIDELLRSSRLSYEVRSFSIAPVDMRPVGLESSEVGGTMFGLPVFTSDTREHLLSLRRKIVESGVPLKSPDELDQEIDEIRGRGSR